VIVLSDQEIAQRKGDPRPDRHLGHRGHGPPPSTRLELEGYERFRITESGVSPISEPAARWAVPRLRIEHTEVGAPTASGVVHARMTEKRFLKLRALHTRRDLFEHQGRRRRRLAHRLGEHGRGGARGFADAFDEGLDVQLLVPRLVYPVVERGLREFFSSVRMGS
jgi:2-oxoglutarate ferredoxin oxidoreductase subunit alpha